MSPETITSRAILIALIFIGFVELLTSTREQGVDIISVVFRAALGVYCVVFAVISAVSEYKLNMEVESLERKLIREQTRGDWQTDSEN